MIKFYCLLFCLLFCQCLQAQELDTTMWVTDRPVLATARSGNAVYLGGDFTCVGPNTGGGGTVNLTSGKLTSYEWFPNIKGQVMTSIPDGKGGWYIGGSFTHVQGTERKNIAHILADNSLDLSWDPKVEFEFNHAVPGGGGVLTMVISGNSLYIGGRFFKVGDQHRTGLASINIATGEVNAWQHEVYWIYDYKHQYNISVQKLDVKDNILYIGGDFQNVDDQERHGLAAINITTNKLTDWNPDGDIDVNTFIIHGDSLYVGGIIIPTNSQTGYYLATINIHNGQIHELNPGILGTVHTLALYNNLLYVGGRFERMGLTLFAVDLSTQLITNWNPKIEGKYVKSIAVAGNTLYAGGNFYGAGGKSRTHLAAIDITTAQVKSWAPVVNSVEMGTYLPGGFINSLTVSGDKVYVGGQFFLLGGEKIQNLAALDAITGRLIPWKLNVTGTIRTMLVSENTLYLAGDIGTIDGQTRSGLASINIATGKATSWNPVINNSIHSFINKLKVHDNKAYFSSHFGKYIGIADLTTGNLIDWDLQVNNGILDFDLSEDKLYIVGPFTTAAGQERNNIASFNLSNRQLSTWYPSVSFQYWPSLRTVVAYQEKVIVGGHFYGVNDQVRGHLAAFDKNTAQLLPWAPLVDVIMRGSFTGIFQMSIYNGMLYIGGYFNSVNDQPRNNVASIDIEKAEVTSWQVNLISLPYAFSFFENVIYVAGIFDENILTPHFAAFGKNPIILKNYITGRVYEATSNDCTTTENRKGIENIILRAFPGPYYGISDSLGNYSIKVDPGTYTVQQVLSEEKGILVEQVCPINPPTHTIRVDNDSPVVSGKNFGNTITRQPFLRSNVVSDRRRRCFTNSTTISYCNEGSAVANDAKVHLQLPQHVVLVSASADYTMDEDKNYVFSIGALQAGDCGTIQIKDSVACNNPDIRGLTQCTKVWITPANPSNPSPDWDRSDIILQAKCLDNGRVKLGIYNTSSGSMADSSAYRIFLDAQVIFSAKYKLNSGDSLILQVPANGQTVRLEADQSPFHPTKQQSNISIEACGVNKEDKISTGFLAQLPQDDAEPEIAIECLPIIDSFDPNDKLALPVGVTGNHYTPTNTVLDYTIRFQNTGTDYAYQVVVIDTLSEHLDISTLKIGAASHEYQLNVSGKGRPVLTFTFNNILLPDSTTDQDGSNGYIKFSIKPMANNAERTRIENFADIFFDYNEPVRTNTVLNTIYDLPLPTNNDTRIGFCNTNQQPSISLLYQEDLVCDLEAETYEWFLNGNPLTFTTKNIKVTQEGTYTVRVDSKGCLSAVSEGFSFTLPPPLIRSSFEIYPNPNNGIFTFHMIAPAGKTIEATLWDALGRQVWEKIFITPQNNIIRQEVTLPEIETGIYILKTTVDTPQGGNVKRIFIK